MDKQIYIYNLLNLVLLLLVVLVGWPRDIVLARTLLATDRWLFVVAAVVIVVPVVIVLLLIRPFLLIIIVVLFLRPPMAPRPSACRLTTPEAASLP